MPSVSIVQCDTGYGVSISGFDGVLDADSTRKLSMAMTAAAATAEAINVVCGYLDKGKDKDLSEKLKKGITKRMIEEVYVLISEAVKSCENLP